MSGATSEVAVFKPTNELSRIFGEPALVGQEKRETYDEFLLSIALAIKPTDAIGGLLTRNYANLAWDIERERSIMAGVVKYYQKEVVRELIKELAPAGQFGAALYRIFQVDDNLTLWETDPEARAKIETALAEKGHTASAILAQAYMRGGAQIDTINRRMAGYERRRDAILKEAGLWNEHLRRRMEQATTAIIDGEFTEATADEGQ
jgi:hypothetical protein